jgi:hypothetical protein
MAGQAPNKPEQAPEALAGAERALPGLDRTGQALDRVEHSGGYGSAESRSLTRSTMSAYRASAPYRVGV